MFEKDKNSVPEKSIKKPVVSDEMAQAEIESWLDFKKIDEAQREDQESAIKALISYVKSGNLELNADKSFTHNLKFPIETAGISKLTYKARITEREITQKLHGIKGDDGDGRLAAHIAALTGEVIGIVRAMDKEDFKIARSIAVFFV